MTQKLVNLKKKENTDHSHDKYVTTPEINSVLQQKAVTCSHNKVVNIYVVYEITNFPA